MLIPYGSDAPLYHRPLATIGLIVVNVLFYFCWPLSTWEAELNERVRIRVQQEGLPADLSDEELWTLYEQEADKLPADLESSDWRAVQFGAGLHPEQWLFASFVHDHLLHLVSSMFFLWALGLVVEGKVGWWKFLVIYLVIGFIGYGVMQVLMLGAEEDQVMGASLPTYGLLVVALLWAPLNELNCVMVFGRGGIFSVSILYFALGFLALQLLILFFVHGMSMSSEALHLTGALVGLPIGLGMLLFKKVDCENYDAISVWRGRHEMSREELAQERDASPEFQAKVASQKEAYVAQIEKLVAEGGDPALAWTVHLKMRHRFDHWRLPEPTLRGMIKLYQQRQQLAAAVPAMQELLRCYSGEHTHDIRLLAAQIMARNGRPRQALHTLAKIEPAQLDARHRAAYDKIKQSAERRLDDIELEDPIEDF